MAEPMIAVADTTALDVTPEQRQALAECVAVLAAHPHLKLSKHPTRFLLDLWAVVALDETLEG